MCECCVFFGCHLLGILVDTIAAFSVIRVSRDLLLKPFSVRCLPIFIFCSNMHFYLDAFSCTLTQRVWLCVAVECFHFVDTLSVERKMRAFLCFSTWNSVQNKLEKHSHHKFIQNARYKCNENRCRIKSFYFHFATTTKKIIKLSHILLAVWKFIVWLFYALFYRRSHNPSEGLFHCCLKHIAWSIFFHCCHDILSDRSRFLFLQKRWGATTIFPYSKVSQRAI